jgi:hypothetical protein
MAMMAFKMLPKLMKILPKIMKILPYIQNMDITNIIKQIGIPRKELKKLIGIVEKNKHLIPPEFQMFVKYIPLIKSKLLNKKNWKQKYIKYKKKYLKLKRELAEIQNLTNY